MCTHPSRVFLILIKDKLEISLLNYGREIETNWSFYDNTILNATNKITKIRLLLQEYFLIIHNACPTNEEIFYRIYLLYVNIQ